MSLIERKEMDLVFPKDSLPKFSDERKIEKH
jgi:hypothetical protein